MNTPYYEMFSDRGNAAVHAIVEDARAASLEWSDVEIMLFELSKNEDYAEASDTAVRDAVYIALGFSEEF